MTLRGQALGGARYLMAREGIGLIVRTAGILLVTALIGPVQYGLFAGPFFVVQFCAALATFGVDLFLIRRAGEVEQAWYHQAFTFLAVSSVSMALAGMAVLEVVSGAVPDSRVIAPLQVLLLSIPLNILWIPAKVTLERRFDYRRLAVSELGADAAQYVVAVALALAGAGVWAAVAGFLVRQMFMLASSYVLARYRPRWRWNARMVREMLSYGGGVTGAALTVRARDLVVTVVVGRYLGAAGVGVAALSLRLVESVAFVNRATYRVSMVALARIQDQPRRLRAAVEEASALQVLAAGPILVALSLVATVVLPDVIGHRWSAVAVILPYVALNALLNALLSVQNAALLVLGRKWPVLIWNVAGLLMYFGAAFVLVPWLGLSGLGLAMLVSLVAFWLRNLELRRSHGVRYRLGLPWVIASAPLLFVGSVPWWGALLCCLPAVGIAISSSARAQLRDHLVMVWQATRRSRNDGAQDAVA